MTKTIALYGVMLLCSLQTLQAQQEGKMETDRPDQTESPYITKLKYLQGEIGFNIEKANGLTTLVHPTALWKYGLSKRFELRLITQVISVKTPLIIPAGNTINTGLLPVQLGGKLALFEEKGLLPKTSLLFHVAPAKLASKKFQAQKWAPNFRFSMQNSLSKNISLGYNLGAEWDGESDTPFWIYTLATGFNLGNKWYTYTEVFGSVRNKEHAEHNADIGFAYSINDDLRADISSGLSLMEKNNWYVAVGVSFRFSAK
ncbi:MAG TPA: transporter [Chitinophagaceae bacterium]|nr:transporter [Chitinophagaceae bacterium]